jgi:transcriptional regulator with XRE-family HTH domain
MGRITNRVGNCPVLRLRLERLRRRWSLNTVAGLTGIGESDLSQIERLQVPAYPGWRRRLARAFEQPEELLFQRIEAFTPAVDETTTPREAQSA